MADKMLHLLVICINCIILFYSIDQVDLTICALDYVEILHVFLGSNSKNL